jgi:hypothetical protein
MGVKPLPIPWRPILLWAIAGTVLAVTVVLVDVARNRDSVGGLIHTGPNGPAAELIALDFPEEPQFRNGEHDGPMVYAIARAPNHLDEAAANLDRPRYRLQHPLLSWLGWLGHPTGGGQGLVWSLFFFGALGLLVGGIAMGALSATLRGPAWLAVIFPILPGSIMSLRITVADALAFALVLVAITLFVRGRSWSAAAIACLAVLAKEPVLLTLIGVALWRRDRTAIPLVAAPAGVAAAWAIWLRLEVPTSGDEVIEFVRPFQGWVGAVRLWVDGHASLAILAVVGALVAAVVVLVRRTPAHPLYFAVLLNLLFFMVLDRDVVGLDRNGTRMTLPLLVVAVLALATPKAARLFTRQASSATTLASAHA